MLIYQRKYLIILLASLVIVLAQFGTLLHAAEHPFHQEDSFCIAFQNAEQNKHFFYHVPSLILNSLLAGNVVTLLAAVVPASFNHYYSSRAPPVFII